MVYGQMRPGKMRAAASFRRFCYDEKGHIRGFPRSKREGKIDAQSALHAEVFRYQ
jgi:hypothetical protein